MSSLEHDFLTFPVGILSVEQMAAEFIKNSTAICSLNKKFPEKLMPFIFSVCFFLTFPMKILSAKQTDVEFFKNFVWNSAHKIIQFRLICLLILFLYL